MDKIKQELKKLPILFRNKYFLIAFVTILIIGGILIYKTATQERTAATTVITETTTTTTKDPRVLSKLSGTKILPDQLDKKVLAMVVENHPDARPQSGLDAASIIYETIAEGGITRFLALFQEQESTEIGPVRSARAYFLDWVLEYDALFAHVGGSIEATDLIGSLGVQDLNQFSLANYFWRSSSRYAPHNVYTTTENIRNAGKARGYSEKSDFTGLSFKEDKELTLRPLTAFLEVNFTSAAFSPTYTYDRVNNIWLRSLNGIPFKLTNGVQVAPKNIIVEYTTFAYGITRVGEQSTKIGSVGSGKAEFFIDGEKIEGTWTKVDHKAPTIFKDTAGNPIVFSPGQTWVEVIPNTSSTVYSKT